MIELLNTDCMEYMRDLEDNAFDLAIVDPPYRDSNDPTRTMRLAGSMDTIVGRLEELEKAVDDAKAAARAAWDAYANALNNGVTVAWAAYDAYNTAYYAYWKARRELKAYKKEHKL